jgi:hypothetical protein
MEPPHKEFGMISTNRRQSIIVGVLLLACCLASATAVRAEHLGNSRAPGHGTQGVASLESRLARFGRILTSLWAGNGAIIDPFGNPQNTNPTSPSPDPVRPLTDNGPIIDPFGGH